MAEVEKVAVTQEDKRAARAFIEVHNVPTFLYLEMAVAFARRRIAGLEEAKGIAEERAKALSEWEGEILKAQEREARRIAAAIQARIDEG